ncbi:MAG TPA: alpha-L-arabinofuranosidase C-terminal domain-containing protein [Acidobacteriaceae bacterium]|nr:alpha-L-arabinofuranosidase C-terminal domain-containing protein [Acidobacteriaceae bacterium]
MRPILPAFVLLVTASIGVAQTTTATLTIDASHPAAPVSPMLYGIMSEEINHAWDGGLYGELVSNRTFQPPRRAGRPPQNWIVIENGNSEATLSVDTDSGPSKALAASLKLDVLSADAHSTAGFFNTGYWGIAIRPATTYRGSFYAKVADSYLGPITIRLVHNQTNAVAASTTVPALTSEWKQVHFTLKTGTVQPSANYRLEFLATHPGTAWFTLLSLFPPTWHEQPNGFRPDLMEKLEALHPKFLRFPGGNFLEGQHLPDHFDWKRTVGPLVDRPGHPTPWMYRSSDGMGLLEMLTWCEDLHMEPLLAIFSGYALDHTHINPGTDLAPYVQDALDEIEYITGDVSTHWGAERARDGHPAPFPLHYVEIGNEEYHDPSGTYDARFAQFYHAIKKDHPHLQIVASAPVTSAHPDLIDDNDHEAQRHFYRTAKQFFDDVHRYDTYDRNGTKILVGEWATREGTPTTNLGAALGDAAWMTGLERNSDIVAMASYAPLFVNVSPFAMQWEGDLIGFDALTSYGSPSYYAQVMFSNHLGDQILGSTLNTANPLLFESVTCDAKTGRIYLKLVNASSEPQSVDVKINGGGTIRAGMTITTLRGATTKDTNSITDPQHVVPIVSHKNTAKASFRHLVPQYAIQVLEIERKP